MKTRTFQHRYCEQLGLRPEEYLQHVFLRALYPHARWLRNTVVLFNREHFRADYDFVHDVGCILAFRDFDLAVEEFVNHPANRGVLRHVLRFRISARRMFRIVRATLEPPRAEPTADMSDTPVPWKPASRSARRRQTA